MVEAGSCLEVRFIVQLTHLLCTQKARPGTPDRARLLGTEPELPHWKEITECIGDIGQANSKIFSILDLASGFWQMKLDEQSQPLTTFTIPGKGQFHWITSPMGLLGCPASFQRLMEGVLRNLQNAIVYIDDLLVHSNTHKLHLQILEQVLE
jgi:hypothetical protein